MWLDLWKLIQITQELKSILLPNIKATLQAYHMAKHCQVCFHRRPFANPVNLRKCTAEPMKPLDGTNKDVSGAKLQLMTTSVCSVDRVCFCTLLKTQHYCLCPSESSNLPSASHLPHPFPLTHSPTHSLLPL